MLNWIYRRKLDQFQRTFDYDMSYCRDMLAASPRGFRKFSAIFGMAAHAEAVDVATLYAVKITGSRHEDCGPCTQLVVTMAERAGVPERQLRALLEDDLTAMSAEVVLGYEFARAVLAHSAGADHWRQQIVQRWGERGLVTLALALAAARVFPTVKYALGHGQSCVRVQVGGRPIALAQQQSLAPAH